MVEEQVLGEWVSRLVRIPSVNPKQAGPRAGTPGEARIGEAIAGWFQELGGEVHLDEVLPGRINVYGIWRGTGNRWMGVDAHVDTVGVEQMLDDPFSGAIADGRVYGRGSVDTKATLGVTLALLEALHRGGKQPAGNLLVAATVDEEVDANGAPAFAAWVRGQGLVLDQLAVAEPTLCRPVHGHKGVLRMTFEIEGVATHSSQPHLGKNALTAGAHLALALAAENQRLQAGESTTALGPGTLTVTVMRSGRGENVVPDSCTLTLDRRLSPGEGVLSERDALAALARQACPLPFEVKTGLQINPYFQEPGAPWVRKLAEWSGHEPSLVPYGTNAWAYGDIARECVVIGPGSIDQAHGNVEWVALSELKKLADIFSRWWEMRDGEG